MPAELDETRRKIMQLEIEREALKKETDPHSAGRLETLEKELSELQAEYDEMSAKWQEEKQNIQKIRTIKEEIDQVKADIENAEHRYDLNTLSELKYGKLPDWKSSWKMKKTGPVKTKTRCSGKKSRRQEIAEIVAKWTEFP
jgi:ATP-dependent Clp protease ATP-binding subunit ClpB